MRGDRLIQVTMLGGAALFLALGAWAFLDPSSFYDGVATYPPYNRHLLHDVGAFQLGLGAALLVGLVVRSARVAALWAVAAAAVFHAVSHVVDRDLGGRSSDPLVLSLLAAALVGAALLATGSEAARGGAPPAA